MQPNLINNIFTSKLVFITTDKEVKIELQNDGTLEILKPNLYEK